MKILIVTESVPFPAYNGRELPVEGIFSRLCVHHTVHLLVIGKSEHNTAKLAGIPAAISFTGFLPARRWSNTKRLLQAIKTFSYTMSPFMYSKQEISAVITDTDYDFLWVSPVSQHGFATFCRQHQLNFFKKVALGLNDSKTYLYKDQIHEITKTGIFHKDYFMHWMQSILIKGEEKKYLRAADLVHVQTVHESNKAKNIAGNNATTKFIVASNGIKQELFSCTYKGIDSPDILFMTHLDGGRAAQSKWFIQKIWPVIHTKIPAARLLIIGKPPAYQSPWIDSRKNIIVQGYAADLTDLFNQVRLVVVPTFHGTGFINRIADAMAAGVPVISTPQAIATFPGIQTGIHILAASDAANFANAVIHLYNNREQRETIAQEARCYARTFATWDATAKAVEKAMQDLL